MSCSPKVKIVIKVVIDVVRALFPIWKRHKSKENGKK